MSDTPIEWKSIPSFLDYEVSNLGDVRRATPGQGTRAGRVIRPTVKRNGYQELVLRKDKKNHTRSVHRLVASAFLENDADLSQVNHRDGDKTNNTLVNLEWVTPQENIQHAHRTGLYNRNKHEHRSTS